METSLLEALFDERERRPLTVSELNAGVRGVLEREFSSVWVEGEVVNFVPASSGHWYFNLNDGSAQIKCVCWKGTNFRIRFKPQSGITVRVRGKISFYPARGETQIVVESLEPSGEGALRAAFEQIRATLESEGLFAEELKCPLPYFPRRVAVVTSATGAAYHDIHNVLTRRARSVSILLVPTLVQGETAADSIRQAVIDTNAYNRTLPEADKIDVMIVGRGGGSAEDLWAFNDEQLARTLRASEIPVISAVGHEIDWTIADMIADRRAPTPSAAAEIVAGREEDIVNGLFTCESRLISTINYMVLEAGQAARDAIAGLQNGFMASIHRAKMRFADVATRLSPATLSAKTAAVGSTLSMLDQRNAAAIDRGIKAKADQLNVEMAKLNALSPLAVLTRGFSITQTADGLILRDAASVKPGDMLKVRLERGSLNAEVLAGDS